jgi:hypothetical protein
LLRRNIALNGVRGRINCSLNAAIVSTVMIIMIVIVMMVMTTTTVIVVLRDDVNWTSAKNTLHYGAMGKLLLLLLLLLLLIVIIREISLHITQIVTTEYLQQYIP